ncbi:Molybdenum cofactor cytidylyltransferase [bioreactor metagenome]|uniref:Molybdenum cofactor cytidylyltransferase n=1 Tax=bioreactor metagenome TaxID=1076179 RepID=A0A645HCC8_9ZZZZ
MRKVCGRILVVTGHQAGNLAYIPEKFPDVKLIYNPGYRDGMFSSVIIGLKNARFDRIFLMPGDIPAVREETYRIMAQSDCDILLPAYRDQTGHPVLIKRDCACKILQGPYRSLHEFILYHGYKTVETNDPGILLDTDFPRDFIRLERYMKIHDHHSYGAHRLRQDHQPPFPVL